MLSSPNQKGLSKENEKNFGFVGEGGGQYLGYGRLLKDLVFCFLRKMQNLDFLLLGIRMCAIIWRFDTSAEFTMMRLLLVHLLS